MDFADKLDMMDDDCDIEGFPLDERPCDDGNTLPMDKCCQTCEYWLAIYQQCEHPDQRACEAGAYEAPPDKWCELYERNC